MELLALSKTFFDTFAAFDYTGIILFIAVLVFGMMMYRMHKSESTKFFYDQLFLDEEGKASTSKLAHLTALLISSWAFVHLTLKGTLTEWYFFGYIGAWIFQRSYTKWIDLQKSAQSGLKK